MNTIIVPSEHLPQERANTQDTDGVIIGPIPLLLYEEISRAYCTGEEVRKENYGGGFIKWRPLDGENLRVGFRGTIGIRKQFDHYLFTLWSRTFEDIHIGDEFDYLKRMSEVLEILSGPRDAGMWAYGRGRFIAHTTRLTFRMKDTPLNDLSIAPVVQFASLIVSYASQIANHPLGQEQSFWESEKDPSGDYTEPLTTPNVNRTA